MVVAFTTTVGAMLQNRGRLALCVVEMRTTQASKRHILVAIVSRRHLAAEALATVLEHLRAGVGGIERVGGIAEP